MRLLAAARDANSYDITRDDRSVATVSLHVRGSGRVALADGGALLLRREDTLGARYTITRETSATSGGQEQPAPLLRATRPNPLRRSYDVELLTRRVSLRAESPWRGDYLLFESGAVTGAIRQAAGRSRDASGAFPDDLPQDAAIALFCLILAIWRTGHARIDTL